MERTAERASPWGELIAWLRKELEPRPGRAAATARIAANCTITVVIGMVFEIPLPAYMAYVVFLASRDEYVETLKTVVGAAIAVTLAVGLLLLFYMIDAGEPALRIPLMAFSTFVGMFLVRTSALGPISFLVGYLLVLGQTLIDVVPTTEALTRLVLWLWVIIMIPAALTTVVDLALGRSPAKLLMQTALRLLDAVTATLRGHPVDVSELQTEALRLLELRQHAQVADRTLRALGAVDHRLIETGIELLTLLPALPAKTPSEIRAALADASQACRRALASTKAPLPASPVLKAEWRGRVDGEALAIVVAIADALGRFAADIGQRRSPAGAPPLAMKMPLLVADAWSNPEHARFALKTTIAVMAAYFIYSMNDWPGTRTAVTTCFFVALGTFGESIHKLTLRIVGASIGGLLATICIVYALPRMTDIGQLALLIGVVSALAAWISTSSERLSYLGMQLAFAFFLGVLHDYGPTTDLTTARDRFVGILLGNVLIALVFSTLWPKSALERAREVLAGALAALGDLVRNAGRPRADTLTAIQKVAEAKRFVSIAMFEGHLLERADRRSSFEKFALESVDRLAAAAFVVAAQPRSEGIGAAARAQDEAAGRWFTETSQRIVKRKAPPPPPARLDAGEQTALATDTSLPLRAALGARAFLQREIEHAAAIRS